MHALRIFYVAVLLLAPVALLTGKPTNPNAKAVPKAVAPKTFVPPKLEALTNWGYLTHQEGQRSFKLHGHPLWDAECQFRDTDNRIVIIWTNLNSGDICPGVYDIVMVDGVPEIRGEWGYSHDVRIEADGKLSGNARPDRVHRIAPPEPDF